MKKKSIIAIIVIAFICIAAAVTYFAISSHNKKVYSENVNRIVSNIDQKYSDFNHCDTDANRLIVFKSLEDSYNDYTFNNDTIEKYNSIKSEMSQYFYNTVNDKINEFSKNSDGIPEISDKDQLQKTKDEISSYRTYVDGLTDVLTSDQITSFDTTIDALVSKYETRYNDIIAEEEKAAEEARIAEENAKKSSLNSSSNSGASNTSSSSSSNNSSSNSDSNSSGNEKGYKNFDTKGMNIYYNGKWYSLYSPNGTLTDDRECVIWSHMLWGPYHTKQGNHKFTDDEAESFGDTQMIGWGSESSELGF